ncbi:MAG: hypothetical protein ACI308_04315 [Muribaculaceae bacterium]
MTKLVAHSPIKTTENISIENRKRPTRYHVPFFRSKAYFTKVSHIHSFFNHHLEAKKIPYNNTISVNISDVFVKERPSVIINKKYVYYMPNSI